MSVESNVNIKECPYKNNCISWCAECDIIGSGLENCDECYPICRWDGNYEDCEGYKTMEVIKEAEEEAGIEGGCIVDMEQHNIFLERKKKNIKTTSRSHKKTGNEADLLNYTEMEEYYKDILIGFFIELPEILLDLNINFTPEKYHRFVEETKSYLLKSNIML